MKHSLCFTQCSGPFTTCWKQREPEEGRLNYLLPLYSYNTQTPTTGLGEATNNTANIINYPTSRTFLRSRGPLNYLRWPLKAYVIRQWKCIGYCDGGSWKRSRLALRTSSDVILPGDRDAAWVRDGWQTGSPLWLSGPLSADNNSLRAILLVYNILAIAYISPHNHHRGLNLYVVTTTMCSQEAFKANKERQQFRQRNSSDRGAWNLHQADDTKWN